MSDQTRVLEAIVTTERPDGVINIAPMGPRVADDFREFRLQPYQSSETFANLSRTSSGVLHVTDDVEIFARAAIGQWAAPPAMRRATAVEGCILADACRWYAFTVESIDDSADRSEMQCRVVDQGRLRDFFGFNRAMHAVIEAAILATRIQYLPIDEILRQFDNLTVLIHKTGGPRETAAFALVDAYVRAAHAGMNRA